MKNIRINGWDERDYRLWSGLQSLPSYGIVAGDSMNPMLARKDVERLLEKAAEKRFSPCAAQPAGTPEQVRELVAKWRERALTRSSEREIATLETCANQLEAALAAAPQGQQGEK
jgi:2-C-methyl-D-erythritol 4-phosphate cytidylyltransferase